MDKIISLLAQLSFDQWISIAAQLFTLITVILVYLQLRESSRQRQSTYLPELSVPKIDIYIYPNVRIGSIEFPLLWSNTPLESEESEIIVDLLSRRNCYLRFYNLGFAAAKNIEIKWTTSFDDTLEKIQQDIKELTLPVIIEGRRYSIGGALSGEFSQESLDHLDYIAPVSISPTGESVEFPYQTYISLVIYTMMQRDLRENRITIPSDLIPMELLVTYEDLGNRRYEKKYTSTVSESGISTMKVNDVKFDKSKVKNNRRRFFYHLNVEFIEDNNHRKPLLRRLVAIKDRWTHARKR